MSCTSYFNCNQPLGGQEYDVIKKVGLNCANNPTVKAKCGSPESANWVKCASENCGNACFSCYAKGLEEGDPYKAILNCVNCPMKPDIPPWKLLQPGVAQLTPAWAPLIPGIAQLTPSEAPITPSFAKLTQGVGVLTPSEAPLSPAIMPLRSQACLKYFDCNVPMGKQVLQVIDKITQECMEDGDVKANCSKYQEGSDEWMKCSVKYCKNGCWNCFVNGRLDGTLGYKSVLACAHCPMKRLTPPFKSLIPAWKKIWVKATKLDPAWENLTPAERVLSPAWKNLTLSEKRLIPAWAVLSKPDKPIYIPDKPIVICDNQPTFWKVIFGFGALFMLLYLVMMVKK